MDSITIEPSMLKGTVTVPPSKSMAHRIIIASALSEGECEINNIAMSEDIEATLSGLNALGYKHKYEKKSMCVKISPKKRKFTSRSIEVDCGESGSTLRFLMPIALMTGRDIRFTGRGRLMQRPMKPYINMFEKCGISFEKGEDYIKTKGVLKSGEFEITGGVSSQFISGLLFALPLLDGDSIINITDVPESTGYIDMTIDVLKKFGIEITNHKYIRYEIKGGQKYKPVNLTVEGDYSQAAFFLTAGALGCDVECLGLSEESLQGDKEILNIIERAGGIIDKTKNGVKARHTANMHAIEVDARNIPDLVPTVAVLLAFCKGESRVINAGRLRMKESDRLSSVCDELSRLGVDISEGPDYLVINGGQTLRCETVSARNDHRIAMALAIAACRCEGEEITIIGAEKAVKKSYPDFFEVYNKLKYSGEISL